MSVIDGIYTKDFPSLGRAVLTTDLVPIAVTGDAVTYKVTIADLRSGSGTVTSVAALTLGTTGTDLSSTVATGTTTPVITLNVPTASAANRGALSAADWSTFNAKAASGATFTLGSTSIALGSTTTTVAGLSSLTSTTLVGALTGHASLDLPLTGGTMVGNIIATDNQYDLGANGATRFRTGYFGTSVKIGGSLLTDELTDNGQKLVLNGNTANVAVSLYVKNIDNTASGRNIAGVHVQASDGAGSFYDGSIHTYGSTYNVASFRGKVTVTNDYGTGIILRSINATPASAIIEFMAGDLGYGTDVRAYITSAAATFAVPILLTTDNTHDIGASGATRPRTGYFGTSLISPLVNGLTITNNGTNTLNIAAGKTLTNSNTLTLTATDGSTLAIGTGGTLGSNAYTSTAYLPLTAGTTALSNYLKLASQSGTGERAFQFTNSSGGTGNIYTTGGASTLNYVFATTTQSSSALTIADNGNITAAGTVNGTGAVFSGLSTGIVGNTAGTLGTITALPATTTATTAAANTNSTLVATTAYADARIKAIIPFAVNTTFNPADAGIYFTGGFVGANVITTVGGFRPVYVNEASTITAVSFTAYLTGNGSGESNSIYIRVNNTTDYLVSSAYLMNTGAGTLSTLNTTGLSIGLNAGDYYEVKLLMNTLATNPTGVLLSGNVTLK